MKFSIILPIYKVEKYLRECIESILCQTFKDYEIILVDDGSPDSCPQICDEYALKYPNIQCIHRPNGGLSAARNSGLLVAKGEYVMFVDSDDFLYDKYALDKVAQKSNSSPEIIHYRYAEWYESDNHIYPRNFSYDIVTDGRSVTDIYCELIDKDAYISSAWSKAVQRKFLIDNNILFERNLLGEDNEWSYHVIMLANKIELIDDILYVYRRRGGSITTSSTQKNLTDLLYVIEKWEKILIQEKDNERTKVIWMSLAKQYCSALIIYSAINNAETYYQRLSEKSYLLQYSKNRRVVIFRRIKRLIGLSGLIKMLRIYQKIR